MVGLWALGVNVKQGSAGVQGPQSGSLQAGSGGGGGVLEFSELPVPGDLGMKTGDQDLPNLEKW